MRLRKMSPRGRDVQTSDLSPSQRRGERAVDLILFRHHEEPRGILIETVHDSRPDLAPDS
jgi:hypothetical protein